MPDQALVIWILIFESVDLKTQRNNYSYTYIECNMLKTTKIHLFIINDYIKNICFSLPEAIRMSLWLLYRYNMAFIIKYLEFMVIVFIQ